MARILLIDDDDSVRRMINLSLSRLGHAVTEAGNGKEGLALLDRTAFDLIITDIVMPEMEGFEVLMALRKRQPPMKTIAISGTHTQKTVAIQSLLKRNGVGPDDFKFIEMPYASQVDSLRGKQVEVVASLDPWTTLFRNSDFARILAYDYFESLPEQPIGGWYARADYATKNGEAMKRFAQSICDVADHMAADPARARKYIAEYTGLDVALVQDTPLNKWTCKINLPVWQKVADMMHEGGELQKPFKIDDMLSDFAKVNVTK